MRGRRPPGTRFFLSAGTRPAVSRDANLTPDSMMAPQQTYGHQLVMSEQSTGMVVVLAAS
jgi:hypothetical protein